MNYNSSPLSHVLHLLFQGEQMQMILQLKKELETTYLSTYQRVSNN